MKKFSILIIGLLLSVITLSGCSGDQEAQPVHSSAPAGVEVQAPEKTVSLSFEQKRVPEGIQVSIFLENPEKEPITSVQAWLAFNPSRAEGMKLDVGESDFSLTAPYKNGFDNEAGLLKIGRAAEGFTDKKRLRVATALFKPLRQDGAIMMEAYNYQNDPAAGNASANVVINGVPYNVLKIPESPALVIQF